MVSASVVVVVVAVALGAFVKGVTGAGLPLIAIPVLASVVGPEEAIVIMALPTVVSNAMIAGIHRRSLSTARDLMTLLVAGVAGAVVGVWVLRALSVEATSVFLAVTIVVYVIVRIAKPALRLSPSVGRYTAPPVGFVAGAMQGATGVSGPVIAAYLHSYGMSRTAYLFALTLTLQVFSTAQIVGIAVADLYTADRLLLSALAIVPVVLIVPLGVAASRRISSRAFDAVVLIVLLASAAKLVVDVL